LAPADAEWNEYQQAEQRYRLMLERLPVGVFVHDGETFYYANPAALRIMGVPTQEELARCSPLDVVAPEYRDLARDRIAALLKTGGELPPVQAAVVRSDGSKVDVEVNSLRTRFADRYCVQVMFHDITERKRAVEALRASEERLQLAVHAGELGVFEHDHRTDVIHVSPKLRAIYGWGAEEPASLAAYINLIHPDDRLEIVAQIQRAHDPRGDGVYAVEHRLVRRDGSCCWVTVHSRTMFEGEPPARRPVRTLGTVADITKHRLLEEQLRQAQKLEAIGKLAGGIAHDFNNLLTVINGYCDLIHDELPKEAPQRDLLQEVRLAGERAADLTRQLLAFSRKQLLQPRVVNLNHLIENMMKMLGRLIGEDILFDVVLAPSLGRVKADPGQIEQVLLNLVSNARDAMPGGGKLTIATRPLQVDENLAQRASGARPGSYIVLQVTDTGVGIAPESLPQIFEPFYTTKEVGKGTGLGLATVHGIVTQSGGFIDVDSQVGAGTTVRVCLPQTQEVLPIPRSHQGTRIRPGQGTILVVEDEQAVRQLTRRVLETAGYAVLEATDSEQALALFHEHRGTIQLLITDLVMPRLSGLDLARQLLASHPGLEVLLMSGYSDHTLSRQDGLEERLAYLQKPFTTATLTQKVREILKPASPQDGR